MIDPERIEAQIRSKDQPEKKDIENLRTVLNSEWFQSCLKPLVDYLDASSKALERADLTTNEGISGALKRQGKVEGLRLVFQVLVDEVNEVEDEGESNG